MHFYFTVSGRKQYETQAAHSDDVIAPPSGENKLMLTANMPQSSHTQTTTVSTFI